MASIGRLQFNPADNSFTGFLKTMTLNANITLQPIASPGPNGPHWRVLAENGFELGAGWKKTSQQGAEYVSLSFDAPELPTKLYANLGREAGQDDNDVYAIIWNRN